MGKKKRNLGEFLSNLYQELGMATESLTFFEILFISPYFVCIVLH